MADQYASIIIDISHEDVDRVFQYRIPPALLPQIRVGVQVCVPFGSGNRTRTGYVVEITDRPDYDKDKIKEIIGVTEKSITADARLIELAWWMKEQYGSTMNQALKTVLPVKKRVKARNKKIVETVAGMTELPGEGLEQAKAKPEGSPEAAWKEAAEPAGDGSAIFLNSEQQSITDAFITSYDSGDRAPCLIHGVTGSGKTEVYMALIDHVLQQGKQVIVLIPEIALTFQTVRRFYERFGDRVSVMHSRLSEGERYDQFLRAKAGEIDVMIGPRSALFTPFSQIGVMIIDEEHEGAYKSETVPRYDAREVAAVRAKKHGASLILGSATPSVETSRRAREGKFGWYRLTTRIGQAILPEVSVVDLREELRDGNRSIFSRRLLSAMDDRLKKRQQTMLFLNRRGLSGFVSCRSCGKSIRCPHCDVTLSLHKDGSLRCHYCGYRIPMPKNCPSCGSPYISGFRAGTQQIEREVHRLFPQARVLRMDYDTTRTRESYEQILSAFGNGQADILVGTQMIVKGHDFPDVTLVGIVAADISLYASDYRAAERTFQLLTQAVGRAGRGSKAGEAVIQTYMPEHYSIQTAAKQDYDAFYEQEILYRELMGYPPVDEMLGIYLSGKDLEKLESCAEQLAEWIRNAHVESLCLIGPADAALARKNDSYRKVIYMKHEKKIILLKIKKLLEQQIAGTDNWNDIFIQFDYNPLQAY